MIPYKKAAERFRVPPEGEDILEQILTPSECRLLSEWEGGQTFTEEELAVFLCTRNLAGDREEAGKFIWNSFKRGILNKAEGGKYCFGSFYGRLDIFAVSEAEAYRSLPEEKREELDRWYFESYLAGLGPVDVKRPTQDQILPLADTLAFIRQKEEQAYLALCDCRMLRGECGSPTRTCITYRTADNTFVSRGHAKPITKEEAMQVVIDADRAGLMHTVNPGGVCSCCTDCCYLFRAARARKSQGVWPEPLCRAVLEEQLCVGCGACIRRCPFRVFDKKSSGEGTKFRAWLARPDACVGCGLCAAVCPSKALHLKYKEQQGIGGDK